MDDDLDIREERVQPCRDDPPLKAPCNGRLAVGVQPSGNYLGLADECSTIRLNLCSLAVHHHRTLLTSNERMYMKWTSYLL